MTLRAYSQGMNLCHVPMTFAALHNYAFSRAANIFGARNFKMRERINLFLKKRRATVPRNGASMTLFTASLINFHLISTLMRC